MAEEKRIGEENGNDLSQSKEHVEIKGLFSEVFEEEACKEKSRHSFPPSDKMMTMEEGFNDSFQRPRSFSDASLSSGRHAFKTVKDIFHVNGKKSMKVFVRRESQVMTGNEGEKRSAAVDDMVYGGRGSGFELASNSAERVLSLDNITEKAIGNKSAPPKPRLPVNYRQYLNEQLKLYHETNDKRRVSSGNLQESHLKSDNVQSKSVDRLDKYRDSYQSDKSMSLDTGNESRVKPRASSLRRGRSSVSELPLRPNSVIYRHFDQQFQSELLKKELDTLRISRNVRKKSETMRQWLENGSRPKSTGDLHVRFADELVNKQSKNDSGSVTIKQGTQTLPRQSISLDLIKYQYKTGERTNIHAYPPSGFADRTGINNSQRLNETSGGINGRTHESRSLAPSRGQGQIRSKSATALGRNRDDSRHESEWKPLEQTQKTQLSRSATNLRRKQNTITKFNYSSVEQKRENVKTRFQQSDKKNRIESISPGLDDLDQPARTGIDGNNSQKPDLRSGDRKSADLRDVKPVGDNRSDEEKYAALSRSKIVHSKSFSWDNQAKLNSKTKEEVSESKADKKVLQSPGLSHKSGANDSERMKLTFGSDSNAQRSSNIGAKSVDKLKDKDSRSRKEVDKELPYSDSEYIVNKGAKSVPNVPNVRSSVSQQGKIVLRQCRIGSDVVFGLVAVQDSGAKAQSSKVRKTNLLK